MEQRRGDGADHGSNHRSLVVPLLQRDPGADRRAAKTKPPPRARRLHQQWKSAEEGPRKRKRRSKSPKSPLMKRRRKSSNRLAVRTTSFNFLTSCRPELD